MMRASLLVMLVTLLYGCGERIERFGGPTMGSTYSIQYVPTAQAPGAQQVKAEVERILEALDKQFSNWRGDSVVARFNALPAPPDRRCRKRCSTCWCTVCPCSARVAGLST